jgi:hypothetical protein
LARDRNDADVGDVLAGDREVVQAGAAERGAKLVGEALDRTEHDAGDERPALAGEPTLQTACDSLPGAVNDSGNTSAGSDDPVVIRGGDDMDALSTEIGALVEAAVGAGATRSRSGRSV